MQFFSYKCWFLKLCLVSATGETWMFVATPCDTQLPSLSWKTFLCPFSSGWWFVGRFLQRCCAGQVVLFSSMLLDHNWQDLKNFYCNVISAFQNYWSWAQTSEPIRSHPTPAWRSWTTSAATNRFSNSARSDLSLWQIPGIQQSPAVVPVALVWPRNYFALQLIWNH